MVGPGPGVRGAYPLRPSDRFGRPARIGQTAGPPTGKEPEVLLRIEVPVDAPRPRVWSLLTDWERQPEWMVDAEAVEVLTPRREGVGVTIRCPTRLLGVRVDDVMRVTRWEDGRRLEVIHLGRVITGSGTFELHDRAGGGTTVVWEERITPPLGAVGRWGADTLVRPLLERLFRRSLGNLATLAERGDDALSRRR